MRLVSKKLRNGEGFTLIELMIVVAIIAILAMIAIPQYRKFQLKSKTSEAKSNLGAIASAEEAFAANYGEYAQCSYAPRDAGMPDSKKHPWSVQTDGAGFDLIGFRPAGDVYYVYGVASGTPSAPASSGNDMANDATTFNTDTTLTGNGTDVTINNGVDARDGTIDITIAATGDLDGDGTKAGFFRTDEETRIMPDPVDAGESEF